MSDMYSIQASPHSKWIKHTHIVLYKVTFRFWLFTRPSWKNFNPDALIRKIKQNNIMTHTLTHTAPIWIACVHQELLAQKFSSGKMNVLQALTFSSASDWSTTSMSESESERPERSVSGECLCERMCVSTSFSVSAQENRPCCVWVSVHVSEHKSS